MSNGPTYYRRGSVFGALLLIGIGGLFLYANLNPDFNPWPLLAKYWPVLLILWGVGKLVDYFILRDTPAAAGARVTAGDIIGLVFLIIFGSMFTRLVDSGIMPNFPIHLGGEEIGCLFGREFEFTQEVKQAVAGPTTLIVSNRRGALSVAGGPGAEIRVVARKKVCAGSDAEAFRYSEAYQPKLEQTGEGLEFRWETLAGSDDVTAADLDIQAPAATTLRLASHRGDVSVRNLQGGVALDQSRGDVNLEKIGGAVRVEIRRGSVRVADVTGSVSVEGRGDEIDVRDVGSAALDGEFYGPIRLARVKGPARFLSRRTDFSASRIDGELSTGSGDLRVTNAPGDISLTTSDRDIRLEGVTGEVRVENRNGGVRVRLARAPERPIRVETDNGQIELVLPPDSSFQITATARNGHIESEFSGLNLRDESGGTQVLTGSQGHGRAAISLATRHGNIYLRRGSAASD